MKRFLLTAAIVLLGAIPALAQTPSDPVHLTVQRQTLQVIGQGLMKLPYETSAPILNDLQAQLNAADKAASDAAQAKAKEDADKVAGGVPADPVKPPAPSAPPAGK